MDPTKYEELRNKTLLFFVEKLLEVPQKGRTLHDLSCQFGSKGFTKEMRQIAGGSQSGLKKFLAQYPSIFQFEGDAVQYFNTSVSVRNSPEFKDNNKSRDYAKEAVEYFRQRLILYGVGIRVPIRSLLGHRSQAPAEIRHVSGQHINEFTEFLAKYSDVFKVEEETVTLKEFEGCVLNPTRGTSNTTNNNNNLEKQQNYFLLPDQTVDQGRVLDLIEFYGKCIQERGPMLVEQIFHATVVHFKEHLFHSPNDLQCFLKLYPQCFQVHSTMVSLSDSFVQGLEFMRSRGAVPTNKNNKQSSHPNSDANPSNVLTKNPTDITTATREIPHSESNHTSNSNTASLAPPSKQNLKTRVNNIVLKTLEQNTDKDYVRSNNMIAAGRRSNNTDFVSALADPETLRNYIMARTIVITNVRKCEAIVSEIMRNDTEIGVDCEGVNLGRDGEITLIQIARSDGSVYIFDVLTQSKMAEVMREMLESEKIVKVLHDCKSDSFCLDSQFHIRLKNVFDTQSAHSVIQSKDVGDKVKNISLNNLCTFYNSNLNNPFKDKIKNIYRGDNRYWSRRPLNKQMICYASCDVMCLVPYLYNTLSALIVKLDPEKRQLFQTLCKEQVLSNISPDEVRAQKRLRKNEQDLLILRGKLEKCHDSDIVLSNREIRLLKHMELSETDKEKLRRSLKVAKKLERLESVPKDEDDDQQSSLDSVSNDDHKTIHSKSDKKSALEERLEHINQLEAIINDIIVSNKDSDGSTESNNTTLPATNMETINSASSDICSHNCNSNVSPSSSTKTAETQTISTGDIVITTFYKD